MSDSRVVVTGAAGFIGYHLVRRLLAAGQSVLGVDDMSSPSVSPDDIQYLRELARARGAKFTLFQTTDVACGRFIGSNVLIDAVYHLASPVGPVGVLVYSGLIANRIVRGAQAAANVALDHSCPLVFVSSSEVYGGGQDGLCREDMPCIIESGYSARKEYAAGKLAAEIALQNYAAYTGDAFRLVIIRPFNVAGPLQSSAKGFVVPRFVDQALSGESLTLFGDGDVRSFTHVDDIVDGLLGAEAHGKPRRIYNLGNEDNILSIRELANRIAMHERSVIKGKDNPVIQVDPAELFSGYAAANNKFADATLAREELGWTPKRSIERIINDVYDWKLSQSSSDL